MPAKIISQLKQGPDWSGYLVGDGFGIAHERLAIIDPESGAQPLGLS